MIELWRRVILLTLISAACCLWQFSPLQPLVSIQLVDVADLQKSGQFGKDNDVRRYLASLPSQDYMNIITKDKLVTVQGSTTWDDILRLLQQYSVSSKLRNNVSDKEWQDFTGWLHLKIRRVWFTVDDPILQPFTDQLLKNSDQLFAVYQQSQQTIYFEIKSIKETGWNDAPSRLVYSFRQYAPYIAGLGFLLYLFIPVAPKIPVASRQPRSQIIFVDLVALILFIPLFGWPLLLMGTFQRFADSWFITLAIAIVWLPSTLLALWLFKITVNSASLQILIQEQSLTLDVLGVRKLISYDTIESVSRAILKPPLLLQFLSALAVLANKTPVWIETYRGVILNLKNGDQLPLWFRLIEIKKGNFERLLHALEAANIIFNQEIIEKRELIKEIMLDRGPAQGFLSRNQMFLILSATPFLVFAIFFAVSQAVWPSRILAMPQSTEIAQLNEPVSVRDPVASTTASLSAIGNDQIEWERIFAPGADERSISWRGKRLEPAADGGFLMVGVRIIKNLEIILIRTDIAGNEVWQQTLIDERQSAYGYSHYPAGLANTSDQGWLIVDVVKDLRPIYREKDEVQILLVDSKGNLIGRRPLGKEKAWQYVSGFVHAADGRFLLFVGADAESGEIERQMVEIDTQGNILAEYPLRLSAANPVLQDFKPTIDGGLITVGTTTPQGQMSSDLLLVNFDATGHERWTRHYPGEPTRQYRANAVRPTPEGGFLIAGSVKNLISGDQDALVLKTDDTGRELWRLQVSGADDEEGLAIEPASQGHYILLCHAQKSGASQTFYTVLADLTENGQLAWRKTLGLPDYDLGGIALLPTTSGGHVLMGRKTDYDNVGYGGGENKIVLLKLRAGTLD